MIIREISPLKPLIESSDGLHLTAYLDNRRGVVQLKKDLREVLETAERQLSTLTTKEEEKRFLEPIQNLFADARLLNDIHGNIGLFRTQNAFRILRLPIDVENTCIIASSFHVKPLLRWMQVDRDFLFLGIANHSACLYHGNQSSLKFLDKVLFPDSISKMEPENAYQSLNDRRKRRDQLNDTMKWLGGWIIDMTAEHKPTLFLAGENSMVTGLVKHLKYENLYPETIRNSFNAAHVADTCSEIRSILRMEARLRLQSAHFEFQEAHRRNIARRNIFEIARAAVNGRVQKLMITDGLNIFGKLDRKSGDLSIHPTQTTKEDDCLLDDLAQEVLAHGGEVIVGKKEEMPKGQPILALVTETPEKRKPKYLSLLENLKPQVSL